MPPATPGFSRQASSRDLRVLFRPQSVCIVGASSNSSSISGRPLHILRRHGYEGPIYPVNPKYDELAGIPCYRAVAALPQIPDVAIFVIPAPLVPSSLLECAEFGIKNMIIISSGFEEVDRASSAVTEMKSIIDNYQLNVVGPNSEGIWSVPNQTVMTFGSAAMRDQLILGPVAVISQSGSIGGTTARSLQERRIGCRFLISCGNEMDLSISDYLDYLVTDGETEVVLVFLEGLKDGRRFIDSVRRAREAGIQVVALKGGSSKAGAAAAASHTGKITSDAEVYACIFEQIGILQVDNIGDLVDVAEVLLTPSLRSFGQSIDVDRPGSGIALVAPGATRTVMADTAERFGVPLATFSDETVARISEIVPVYGSANNPVDVTAQVSTEGMFDDVLQIMGNDPATDALVIQWGNRGIQQVDEVCETAVAVRDAIEKPVFVGFLGDRWELGVDSGEKIRGAGIGFAPSPDEVLARLSWLYRVARFQRHAGAGQDDVEQSAPGRGGSRLGEWSDSAPWFRACGFTVPNFVALSTGRAAEWRRTIEDANLHLPVVVKADPEFVLHKAELGLVAVNVNDIDQALSILEAFALRSPDVPSFLVQEMADGDVEALVTIREDADFGPVLTIGLGGRYVELIHDVRHVSLPASRRQIDEAINRTRLGALLDGIRGSTPADREAFVNAVFNLSRRNVLEQDGIRELELNPVIVGRIGEGAAVVDVIVGR
jgi:acyl-CoA synthetase (NDP forming)